MSDVIEKKLGQMKLFTERTEKLLAVSFDEFRADTIRIAAAERNFQLLIDLASDVNAQILVEKYGHTPDTYRQTFTQPKNFFPPSKNTCRRSINIFRPLDPLSVMLR